MNGDPNPTTHVAGPGTKRLLWLGNHRLLLQTELPHLRHLGFEVFHPPCRRLMREHQSASTDWAPGPTTLPPDVHARLVDADFYFKPISPEVFAVLNHYFDAAIVTIQARWVAELLRGFGRTIIYRTYGDAPLVSEQLLTLGAFRAIAARHDVWFVPHAVEHARQEQPWLRRLERVVPYCIDPAVAAARDSWSPDGGGAEIMLTCPNIAGNPYFGGHYAELKQCFNHPSFRIYGLQSEKVDDPQVMGTLPFQEVVNRYRHAAGALYTYRQPTVCFLQPIEMMIVGGPVVFLAGSLLDLYMPSDSPGRARDMLEAREKCERLLAGDRALSRAIVSSQAFVRERYLPEAVLPAFDDAMRSILAAPAPKAAPIHVIWSQGSPAPKGSVLLLAHAASLSPRPGPDGFSSDDPTVVHLVNLMKGVLNANPERRFTLTCRTKSVPAWHGFLSRHFNPNVFSLFPVGPEMPVIPPSPSASVPLHDLANRAWSLARRWLPVDKIERRFPELAGFFQGPFAAGSLNDVDVVSLHPGLDRGLAAHPVVRLYAAQQSDADLVRRLARAVS
jgi:hypothetical protein